VRKIAAEFLRPVNQGLVPLGSASGFTEYVDGTYIPVVLEQMAVTTKDRYQGILRNYLKPQFGGLALRDITTLSVGRYLAGFRASKLGHESLDKIRDALSSVLSSAVRHGLLLKNPAVGVRLPRKRGGAKQKPWITRAQLPRGEIGWA
jgi:site-specific recombinase XerC